MRALILACLAAVPAAVLAQTAERQLVVTITSEQLKGGVVSEITWDGGAILLQGVFALPSGALNAQYFVKPADGITLQSRTAHTEASARYWDLKSRSVSPTGLGRITTAQDAKMPMYGIASQEQRMITATQMGGTQIRHLVKLNSLVLHERHGEVAPYDGEIWSWSPLELNRVAYVNGSGDLWIARADGNDPQRILKGNFTLPAWSDDGRMIAVAERKNNGKRWEISVVTVPKQFLR
jgi:Tol biopolymer transport system component